MCNPNPVDSLVDTIKLTAASAYSAYIDCGVLIDVGAGKKASVTFTAFDTESCLARDCDILRLYDGASSSFTELMNNEGNMPSPTSYVQMHCSESLETWRSYYRWQP